MGKSKAELIYDIENELVDPETNKITGERVKARLLDMVETMAESAGSGGNMEYWRISDKEAFLEVADVIVMITMLIRAENNGTIAVCPTFVITDFIDLLTAIAFDRSVKLIIGGTVVTIEEVIAMLTEQQGVTLESAGLVPMTEEEFYAM